MNRRTLRAVALSLLAALSVAAVLAGCGGGKTPSRSHTTTTTSSQTKKPHAKEGGY